MNKTAFALLTFALLVAGCNVAGAQPAGIDGRTFLSVDVTVNGVQRPLVPGTRVMLSFRDGNLGAQAGCNHLGGAYRIDGDRLVVDSMAMTEMGCDPARHAQDEWLAAFLSSRPQLRATGADLVLEGNGTIVRLTDQEVAEPDRSLTGTRWLLTTIVDGDAASSVPDGVEAWIELTDDGNFSLRAGCNQGGGRYTRDGATITFSDVMLTRMACDEPRAQVEGAVLAVIEAGQVSYTITSDSLTLDAGGRGLGFSAAPER
jgi:heat shock protein HslJ